MDAQFSEVCKINIFYIDSSQTQIKPQDGTCEILDCSLIVNDKEYFLESVTKIKIHYHNTTTIIKFKH